MDKLIEVVLASNGSGIWGGLLVLIVLFFFHKKPFGIVTYYADRKDRDLSFAKDFVISKVGSNRFNNHIVLHIEKALFFKLHKIDASAGMRDAIIEFMQQHDDKVSWTHIRRSYPFVRLRDGKLSVNLHLGHTVLRWATTAFVCLMSALFVILMLYLTINAKSLALSQAAGIAVQAGIFLVGAIAFTSMNWPYLSARRIEKYCTQ